MIAAFPQVHAVLLAVTSVWMIVAGAILLARHPRLSGVRLHFVYCGTLAALWIPMAFVATADSESEALLWARLAHLGIGFLPGVVYHLNVAMAGLSDRFRRRIRAHWAASAVLAVFALLSPDLFSTPTAYAWGLYPRYGAWGLLYIGHIVLVAYGVLESYLVRLRAEDPRSAQHRKALVYFGGICFTMLAMIDFLAAFGIGVYPAGYVVLGGIEIWVVYASIRYSLAEFTPEFAAEYVLNEMPDGVVIVDRHGVVQLANGSARSLLGLSPESIGSIHVDQLEGPSEVVGSLVARDAGGPPREVSHRTESGEEQHFRLSASSVDDQRAFPVATLFTLHDVTEARRAQHERERLEESVRNSQKLESLGVMAAGIAHDFNNILLAILGNAEMGKEEADGGGDASDYLQKIESAAERASELTDQMLTYTGHRISERVPVDLNELVEGLGGLMSAAISKKAELRLELDPNLPLVVADAGQMSQVIMNLITNAAEALEGSAGVVTVRTGTVTPDSSFEAWHDTAAADGEPHALLEVRDDGVGMDRETRDRIFDPFFTTKFTGRGLGLATVLGIVRSHQGWTRVTAEVGQGTTFAVAFPAAAESLPPTPERRRVQPGSKQIGGVALVVDDEPQVLDIASEILAREGFDVLTARDGLEAVEVFQERRGEIDVVVLDRTMPRLDGREAFAILRASAPELPVVFMSGYTDAIEESLDPHTALLSKPFRAAELAETVREAMR